MAQVKPGEASPLLPAGPQLGAYESGDTRMLVVHVGHVELVDGARGGAPAKVRITCGKCPDHGLWFSPMVAETQEVQPSVSAGNKQRVNFDVAFGFPWHAYLEPSVHLSLMSKSSQCFGLWSSSTSVAGAEVTLPFRGGEHGRAVRELQLLGSGGKVLGRATVELELRRVPAKELHERFDLLLADPDRYLHERDYLFPDKIPAMLPGEATRCGAQDYLFPDKIPAMLPGEATRCGAQVAWGGAKEQAAGSAKGEDSGGMTPTLLGRTASNSPKARRRHRDTAKLLQDE